MNTNNPTRSRASFMAALMAVLIAALLGAGFFAYGSYQAHQLVARKTTYDVAYRAHSLTVPFVLGSAAWSAPAGSNYLGHWQYDYTFTGNLSQAYDAASAQLTGGGYQTVGTRPDQPPAGTTAWANRQSITGDIMVTVKLTQPSPGKPVSAIATVTGFTE